MTIYIYGHIDQLRSTTQAPWVGSLAGKPRVKFGKGSGYSFAIKRHAAEEFEDRSHGGHVYAREVPSDLEADVLNAEETVAIAERQLQKARERRQETLLAVAQRSGKVRVDRDNVET